MFSSHLPSVISEIKKELSPTLEASSSSSESIPEIKKYGKIVILHSRDIPDDAYLCFREFGKCLDFNAVIHSRYNIDKFDHDYVFIDIRSKSNRLYLQTIPDDTFKSLDVCVYCWDYERLADSQESFLRLADNVLCSFPSRQAIKEDFDNLLFKPKVKHHSRLWYLLKACFKAFR